MTTDSKQYFKERCGFYEEQPLCKHCSVISTKNIDLKSFQQFSSLGFSNIKRLVNNTYDLRNYNHMKLMGITNSFECIINKENNHSLVFDDNNGKPSSLLQNSLFDIKCVDAFGDCGFLSVILPILSNKIAADDIR